MTDYKEKDVPDQQGRTMMVTGANTGIGWDTARVLAGRGARVLLGCRDESKAVEAMERITAIHPNADLKWIPLDLASLASVTSAAEVVRQESRLDVLINNAGVMIPPRTETADGFELQFGVNHLGHFALTGQVLPMLKDRDGARIVNVSSLAHRNGRIDYDDLRAEQHYDRMKRYQMSKFANILFTLELQRRLEASGSPAISVASHPGVSSTELGRYAPPMMSLLFLPLALFMSSSADGALPSLMAATSTDVSGGDYFGPAGFAEMRYSARKVDVIPHAKDESDARRLWEVSTELTGIEYNF